MKTYEDEAFDDIAKAQQRRIATGVTDGSLWRKRQHEDNMVDDETHDDDEDSEWTCDMCGGPMYKQAHWGYGQCGDCGARQELEDDI
jgi:rubrerythrin